MNIHISNVYGMITNKQIAQNQRRIALIGRRLGEIEFGIYNYYADCELEAELCKRIEGILGAVQSGDIVILQLPTGNGERFDQCLAQKIREHNAELVMMWHSLAYYLRQKSKLAIWSSREVTVDRVMEALSYQEDYAIQSLLTDSCFTNTQEDVIHIAMGVHDRDGNYCSWLGITMQSVIEHTDALVAFHIIHDETLTDENRRKLSYIASRSGHIISFHKIQESYFQARNNQMGIYTVGALFRILLPEICQDLSRIIYFDSDLLVNCDVRKLWNIDIHDYCLAAVPDRGVVEGRIWAAPVSKGQMERKRYFNSGVIYMNLDRIREKGNMCDAVIQYIEENPETNLPDQDALNVIYQNETLLLDSKWNRFAAMVRAEHEQKLKECIYHYVGTICVLYYQTEMDILYMQTAERTPWGVELSEKYMRMSIERLQARYEELRKAIYELCDRKSNFFFYGQENWVMKNMYKLLPVSPQNSCRILEKKDNDGILSCKDLDALRKEDRNSYLVFVLPEADGGRALENLNAMGLVRQKDYFVIPCLLKYEDGGFLA